MLDRERILAKIDQLEGYLRELREVTPGDFAAYQKVEKRRACERLLQISVEAVLEDFETFNHEILRHLQTT